jgi:hypothetical protein
VGVVVEVDVRVPGAVALEQDEAFQLWDGHLLPATTTTSTYQQICSAYIVRNHPNLDFACTTDVRPRFLGHLKVAH